MLISKGTGLKNTKSVKVLPAEESMRKMKSYSKGRMTIAMRPAQGIEAVSFCPGQKIQADNAVPPNGGA
jgi:hypothetical protein